MSNTPTISQALKRVEAVLRRRPEAGIQSDAPATAQWQGGLRIAASHPDGLQVQTDMPAELGGSGDQVSPGWLFRAGLASCSATSILLAAAAAGIELSQLDVKASSRSDARGLLGLPDAEGQIVDGGPSQLALRVRIAAEGVAPERLRALVEAAAGTSPVPSVVTRATALSLHIEIAGG